MKTIFIGGAWPYANGSLHIGHIAALLPGDVIARYYRLKGDKVVYVSGTDCHGTPVTIRAKQEQRSPKEISDYYHGEFNDVFNKFGFSYDLYGKTSDEWHKNFVRRFHKKLYKSKYVCEKIVPQARCRTCDKILTDRLIIGKCPECGKDTRGDQCDNCGCVFEGESLLSPKCFECGSDIEFVRTRQLYIEISKLEKELCAYMKQHSQWRKNAIAFTKRYIDEGLRDRAITRDLEWGIEVPYSGYEDKRIYIWAENVLGYISASEEVSRNNDISMNDIWGEKSRHYYIHGKDNIPFHTIILPALLIANGEGWHLPDDIISSEYLTLEGHKISTSQNWAVWAKEIVDNYNPDALRYFFISHGPEKKDTDFSWREFVESNNSALVGAYGNYVNRTLAFIIKYQNGVIPNAHFLKEIKEKIEKTYFDVGEKIEAGNLKDALDSAFELINYGNKYYDITQPWKTRIENPEKCEETIFNCVQIIANLSIILKPFFPFSSEKIMTWLGVDNVWRTQVVPFGKTIDEVSILFNRIDKSIITQEVEKLRKQV